MCLLDRVLAADDDSLRAEVTIPARGLFHQGDGIGAWVGIEYMAQAMGAWAGWQAHQRGARPKTGFLLGTRRYRSNRNIFLTHEVLQIDVRLVLRTAEGLGQFDCSIHIDGAEVATAAVTVLEPQGDARLEELHHAK